MERHMTKQVLISIAVLGISAGGAFANGDHSGDVLRVLAHIWSEPDHLAMFSLVVIAAVVVLRKYRRQA
jgi:hypothetical protein